MVSLSQRILAVCCNSRKVSNAPPFCSYEIKKYINDALKKISTWLLIRFMIYSLPFLVKTMIELFAIFGKGGLVLWYLNEGSRLFKESVNELIVNVLLQVLHI